MSATPPGWDLEVLIDAATIDQRVRELGAQISKDYSGAPVNLIGILKGSWVFLADLIRHLNLPVTVDFLGVQSYGRGVKPSGEVKITKDLDHSQAAVLARLISQSGEPGETGGEAACFAHLVCPECGAVTTEGHRPGCQQSCAQDGTAYG